MTAMAAVAAFTALLALPVTLVYFERRLPPETADLVEAQIRGSDFDGAAELALLTALTAGLGALLGLLVARRLARPLQAVSAAARRVAAGDLSARAGPLLPAGGRRRWRPRAAPADARDEAARLVGDFDGMAAALERLDTERRVTAAAVAHELRTPLTILQGRLEAVRDGVLPLDAAGLAGLVQQTRTLARLVEDLKTLSLADAGQLSLRRRPVDLAALAATVLAGFRARAVDAGIGLHLDPPRDGTGALEVAADPERLTQVLGNLLDNALRHTPAGGRVDVGLDRRDGEVRLTVRDTGAGLTPEDAAHVFDRFWRAGPSRSRDTGGTGQGLAVVRVLVEAHGGRVRARGQPTGGAEFDVRLPADPGR
ncbi:sensor histidine kinase [Geodermatophilus sp. SYSU D00700]